jgi:hypothetical protein
MGRPAIIDRQFPAVGIRFTVGRDACGHWIVSDAEGKVGGLFSDRASAVHFALFESDRIPGAVWCLPEHVVVEFGKGSDTRRLGATSRVAGRT